MDPAAIRAGVTLVARLPGYLRRRLSLEEARAIQAQRLRHRAARFLAFARTAIYATPGHPMHQLLRHAGCAYGDLEALVNEVGLEETLRTLLRNGVYLSVDEYKGRKPAVRGSASVAVDPDRMRNPRAAFHVAARSSGSRSGGTPVLIDLAFVRACAVANALYMAARGGLDWPKVLWETPGAGSRFRLLKFACFGGPIAAWFTQVDPAEAGLDPMLLWSERALRWGARLSGARLPPPVLAGVEDPMPVVRWLRAALDRQETPYLRAFPSSLVRLAAVALDAGVDLHGTKATAQGEPITQTRLDIMRRAGIDAAPRYGSMECGPVAYGCLRPQAPDDTHVVRDLQAVIQAGDLGAQIGMPSRALFITSLHPAAPFTMLNVSMGDEADLGARDCGCPMPGYGWDLHLANVRSFEKLSAGGVTFYDSDLIAVLEGVLPARFGGSATDYQLVEAEDANGRPAMTLLVHPKLGPLDPDQVADAFLDAIGDSSLKGLMATVWRRSNVLRVERRAPHITASSKIQHLHVDRPKR